MKALLAAAFILSLASEATAITIRHDRGGAIIDYAIKVATLRKSGQPVRIDGLCASACTLHLSLPKSQICITGAARFLFHAARHPDQKAARTATRLLFNAYPGWTQAWINSRGGLTSRDLIMPASHARQYLPACS